MGENVEEKSPVMIEAGKEYDLLQHLTKIPVKISILELVNSSPKYQKQLLHAIHKIQVPNDITPKQLAQTVSTIINCEGPPPISFTDGEL